MSFLMADSTEDIEQSTIVELNAVKLLATRLSSVVKFGLLYITQVDGKKVPPPSYGYLQNVNDFDMYLESLPATCIIQFGDNCYVIFTLLQMYVNMSDDILCKFSVDGVIPKSFFIVF